MSATRQSDADGCCQQGLVAGINNVEWDAVELPSQFMENFLYSTFEVVEGLSTHVDTGEPLPKELWEKLVAARVYMAGSAMLRQLFFGMTDMVLHTRPSASPLPEREDEVLTTFFEVAKCAQSFCRRHRAQAARLTKRVGWLWRRDYTVLPPLQEDRFLCSFSHIFAGGYAAGYYSYKWAEVLSADAFAAFEEAVSNHCSSVSNHGASSRAAAGCRG